MKPKIIRKRWWILLPLPKYSAITIYPFIFIRPGWSTKTMRHELIHCWQVRRDGWLKFYLTYFIHAIKYPYRSIPAEIEAYANDHNLEFLPSNLEALVHADG